MRSGSEIGRPSTASSACWTQTQARTDSIGRPAMVLLSGGTKPVGQAMPSDSYADAAAYRDRYNASARRPVVP